MSSARTRLITEIAARVGRTVEWGIRMNHTAASTLGINATDMVCLQTLQQGPRTAGELARHIGVTTASMTTMIDRLEKAGFVSRTRDPQDRRRVVVELVTGRARADIAPLFAPLVKSWRARLDGYDQRDLELIIDFLAGIEESFAAELEPGRDGQR
ncbi:MarR family transcriptional regulator [Nocardia huaxiensis]|uniref:MarR family transcriptional regulator n=1 Tax=Nocardia huaxiensis TaxID=2755382 RepID=A0A7D6Z370_9NOCA|nr:MarR family transcriptional regulator [Nocardia huaxiensis]QLY29824.1 MarR family transcriptional regulator [Nocardia huaxiensis]